MTIDGSSPTTHVFVPSSVYTLGFGARTRTIRSIASVLPERRARQSLNVVVGGFARLEPEGEQIGDRRALGEMGQREVRRPVELAPAGSMIGEQLAAVAHQARRGLRAVGRRFEAVDRLNGEVPRVEPDRDLLRRDPVRDLGELFGASAAPSRRG